MIGRSFGQHEPLTTRLHNLVRSYPKGLGIFKEFIQNADDAEANEIVFIIDEQQYNLGAVIGILTFLITSIVTLVTYRRSKSYKEEDAFQ